MKQFAQRVVERSSLLDGRQCIHWFVLSEKGPVTTPAATIPTAYGPVYAGGTRGYIACQPQRANILPEQRGGMTVLTAHSDDVRAVTCPKCLATEEAKAQFKALETLVAAPVQESEAKG